MYFHCPRKTNQSVQWHFLSFNYYLLKTLPVVYQTDTKIDSVEISDSGMYTCQTENTIHKRIILTVIREKIPYFQFVYFDFVCMHVDPPKSPDHIYKHTRRVDFNSKHLICCNLDAIPYPSYSWSIIHENQRTHSDWCVKRCCWLHIVHRHYENLTCTSTNQLGTAKYHINLIVHSNYTKYLTDYVFFFFFVVNKDTDLNGEIVYEDVKQHNHNHPGHAVK